jgi:hypothetical protein
MSMTEIHEDLVNTLGVCAPSHSTTARWVAEFKRGRLSIEDDPRSGKFKSGTTEEMIKKVHENVLGDRPLKLTDIVEDLGVAKGTVHETLTTHLLVKIAVAARWMLRLLSEEQKRDRARVCRSNLATLRRI